MNAILTLLRPVLEYAVRHPWRVLLLAAAISAVSAGFASRLRVDTDLANLLPKDNPTVHALEELQNTLGGETTLQVAIRSPQFDANVAFAERLIEEALALHDARLDQPVFKRAEFRRDTEVIRRNALWVATEQEIEQIIDYLETEVRQAKEQANPFLIDFFDEFDFEEEGQEQEGQEEQPPAQDLSGSGSSDSGTENADDLSEFRKTYDRIIPSEYPVNADSTLLVLQLFPSGSKSNIRYLEDMFASMDSVIAALEPAAFHPAMEVRFGGRLKRHLNELTAVMDDVFRSFASGISSVILLVLLYFLAKTWFNRRASGSRRRGIAAQIVRSPVSILLIGVPLLMALFVTFGITWLVLDGLNTMTAVLFVILFGLGIDYGIHFYARYLELRGDGATPERAIRDTFSTTGAAIAASALTTAAALFILVVAEFRGFSEFGFISGTGILLTLLGMLWLLPALLMVLERRGLVFHGQSASSGANPSRPDAEAASEPASTGAPKPFRYPMAGGILLLGTALTLLVVFQSGRLQFEYEFGKLEPEFPEYTEFRRFASGVESDERRNPAYILAQTHSEVFEIMDTLRARKAVEPNSTIGDVEALAERFPYDEPTRNRKLEQIARVRDLLQDPFLRDRQDEDLDLLREASQTRTPLTEQDLPDFLKNRFVTRDGTLGKFVIVYPSVGLSDGRNSIAFKNEIGEIRLSEGRTVHAASTSLVAAEMLDLMRQESPYMVAGTFLMVFVFMLATFRSLRWSLVAAIPLVVGLLLLFGLMLLFDLRFNFYNLVVLPAILGIGCDNGIHVAARFREEGEGSMGTVLRSTGQHITIGSLTTMLGFGGLLFTAHPGLRSIGEMAVLGIGMALTVALTYLPSLLQWMSDRRWI